jgi:hypothetical protein
MSDEKRPGEKRPGEGAEDEALETVEQDDSDEAAIQDDIAADAQNADDDEPKHR